MRPPLTALELRVLRKERARRSRIRMDARGIPTVRQAALRQVERQRAWADQEGWKPGGAS